jgi:predicted ATPase
VIKLQKLKTLHLAKTGLSLQLRIIILASISGDCVSAHILCIFRPGTDDSSIRLAINNAGSQQDGSWDFGSKLEVNSLPDFVSKVRSNTTYPAVCIAAHPASTSGVREEAKNALLSRLDAEIARIEGVLTHGADPDVERAKKDLDQLKKERSSEEGVSLEVLRLIGACGFDALQVRGKKDEKHYRQLHRFREDYGRAVPIVASDAHAVGEVFSCDGNVPYLKISTMSSANDEKAVWKTARKAIRFGETRFSYTSPGEVMQWIAGIEIIPDAPNASLFWPFLDNQTGARKGPFVLPLSRNFNCLIGGRGSGKSAATEALAFLTGKFNLRELERKSPDDYPDWYERAKATLSGCQLKICWKLLSAGGPKLPKKALFVSRYFNPNEEYELPTYTDADEREIRKDQIPETRVQLYRIHDIEKAVEPERLRDLFDDICGPEIRELELDISECISKLKEQREKLMATAQEIAELTEDGAPLRQYALRKWQYEEVNRPDIKAHYEKIDKAAAAENESNKARGSWKGIAGRFDLESRKNDVNDFFLSLDEELSKETNRKNEYYRPLEDALFRGPDQSQPTPFLSTIWAVNSLEIELAQIYDDIHVACEQIVDLHKRSREDLVRKGLPAGAKDREAKKKAFEEAEEALKLYNELISQWSEHLSERKTLFLDLEDRCKRRTDLRKSTAERITNQLSMDLDPTVLVIETDARPMDDKTEFRKWLHRNIAPCFPRYKEHRVEALLKKGLMPESLSRTLLNECSDPVAMLCVDAEKAAEGRISPEEASEIVKACEACFNLLPEVPEDTYGKDFFEKLPLEIREGLWTFPYDDNTKSLRLENVLQLHEIVYEDMPVIRMNDRPKESGSKARPVDELSPGQRCSAILPILLLNGTAPLIIDQPEDNLDNRLIRQVIVNILASIKLRRQVIISTHNPNLPVLGDVEQAIILRAVGEKECSLDSSGNLDSEEVVRYITDIMEGGREAFQYRQSIYQPHWRGPVSRA